MKIEEGVPIPPAMRGGRSRLGQMIRDMKPGDSLLFDSDRALESARSIAKNARRKCVTRKVDGGWRLWIVEKK